MLVDISTTVSYYSLPGFILIPLPSITTLWNAEDVEGWKTVFRLCYEERTLYGLSEAGALTRLKKTDAGIQFSIAEWEEWSAEVSDMGTLVMIVGALL